MNGLCGAEAIIKSLKIVYWIFDSVVLSAICARTSAVVLHSTVSEISAEPLELHQCNAGG